MTGTRDKREKTRAKLLATAYALFMEHGFEAVSIDQITDRCGLSRNSFFNYFESKQGILLAMAQDWYRQNALTPAPLPAGQPALGRLREKFSARISLLAGHRPFMELLLAHSDALDVHQAILPPGEEAADENLRETLALFRQAGAHGELKQGVTPETAFQAYITLRNLVIHAWARNPAMSAGELQAQAEGMMSILLRGCATGTRHTIPAADTTPAGFADIPAT